MTQTVIDSEERYRGQIEKMETDLKAKQEKCFQLEKQMGELLESTVGAFSPLQMPQPAGIRRESMPTKLHKKENQVDILAGALGLGYNSDDGSTDDDEVSLFNPDKEDQGRFSRTNFNSFAVVEQLSFKLKTAEAELKLARKSLQQSNETRQSICEELGEARHAKEKLPLFELRVEELTKENHKMELEIAGLREDIADVKGLYRSQLNVLLEEKAASMSELPVSNKTEETVINNIEIITTEN